MQLHKQIFLTFRLTAGLQRAVNVPRPVNPSVVNPLLPNHVSLTFIHTNVSAQTLNHLAVVKPLLHAASLLANCVAGSNVAAVILIQAVTLEIATQEISAVLQLQRPAVLLLQKHVLQLQRLAVLLHQKLAVLQLQKPAVLLLQKHVLQHQRLAVLLLQRHVLQQLEPVLHQLQILAATKNLAATQILVQSQN